MKWFSFFFSATFLLGLVAFSAGFDIDFEDSEKLNAFVSDGIQVLATLGEGHQTVKTNGELGEESIECKVYCNGEPLTTNECTGHTAVECSKEKDGGFATAIRRMCDGKFLNHTTVENGEYSTLQTCRGVTRLTMKQEKLNEKKSEWEPVFTYKKSCYTEYIMRVDKQPYSDEKLSCLVHTQCKGASDQSFKLHGSKELEKMLSKKGEYAPGDKTVTCNGKPSEFTEPCEGTFVSVEKKTNKTKTITCHPKWITFGEALFECKGHIAETTEYSKDPYQSDRSKNCTGSRAVHICKDKMFGYRKCNGDSVFEEHVYVPIKGVY